MRLTLLGWESSGLRCPDMVIDFRKDGKAPRVSLLQMPNGTGKTTTLDLIKAALTGQAHDWSSDQVHRLRRAAQTNDEGRFVLHLLADNDPLTFELTFDFLEDKVSYRTSSKGSGGIKDGWQPPLEVRRFLNERFVPLFIFNGELAQDLLDGHQTKASEAIDALCQLEHLDAIVRAARDEWQHATRNQGAKTQSGLASWKSREDRVATRLEKVRAARKGLLVDLLKADQKIKELDGQLSDRLKNDHERQQRKDELETKIRGSATALTERTRSVLQLIRQPQFLSPRFAGGLAMLKDQFDRVRLPERTSRQFFLELAEEPTCVCGRPISEPERKAILGKANHYLANELYSFINSLKSDIGESVLEEPVVAIGRIASAIAELKENRSEHSALRTEFDELQAEAVADAGDVAKAVNAELRSWREEKRQFEEMLAKIDEHPDSDVSDDSWSIRGLEQELKRIQETIAQITGTVILKEKLEVISSIAEKTKEIARARLREAIRNDCNSRLATVLSGDPVQIDQIGNSLSLRDQDGASVGQTLAVGYTFLATLLNRGVHKFPLVVDSPAGPLDDGVRNRVGRMIPDLCDQFVAFIISTEREYFLPAIESAAGSSITYVTAFRASDGMKQMLEKLPAGAVRTGDGAVVVERDYFTSFEIPQEQE